MENVINMLLEAGWTQHGRISNPGVVARIAGNRFVGGKFSYRERFHLKKERCTVGKRTVCFYEVGEEGPTNFRNYKTKDLDSISNEINRLHGR